METKNLFKRWIKNDFGGKMITLIIPPSPFLMNDRVFLSLGPLYIAAVLKEKGYPVRILDLKGIENWEEKLEIILKDKNELIGISSTTADFPMAIKILNLIKSKNKSIKVIIGGPHATVASQQCTMFDQVVIGDGVTGIFEALKSNEKIIHGEMIKNLDTLPFPARELIDIDTYHYNIQGRKATNVMSQLGCPYGCAFCCGRNVKEYRTVRFRSPENFIKELDFLHEKYGYSAFMVHDDEFNLNKERTLKICEALSQRDYVFRGFVRTDLFTEEIAEAMAKAGFYQIDVGVESGSERILKVINKLTTPDINSKARAIAKKYGIKFKAFLTIGHPSETLEDIEMTKQWLLDNKPDAFEIYVITPYPGSLLYDQKEKYDIKFSIDYEKELTSVSRKYGEYKCYVSNSHLSSEDFANIREKLDKEVRAKLGLDSTEQIANKI